MQPHTFIESRPRSTSHPTGDGSRATELEYRRKLAHNPHDTGALHALGVLCFETGRHVEGLHLLNRATEIDPQCFEHFAAFSVLLGIDGQLQKSAAAAQRALEINPSDVSTLNNLGVTFEKAGRYNQAIDVFGRAADLAPDNSALHCHLGNARRKAGKLDEAEAAYRRAIAIDAGLAAAWQNLASVLQEQVRHAEALEAFRRALALTPENVALHSGILYAIHYNPLLLPQQIFEEHVAWARRHEMPLSSSVRVFDNDLSIGRRLRIGYLSPDFRRHSTATFVEPFIASHDRSRFEIILYSSVPSPDNVTARFRGMADHWRDIASMPDDRAAELIQRDQIDILVDVTGHMDRNRLLVFARKPAPIQITYIGHPDTTGMEAMDYRLTDVLLDPPGCGSDQYQTEKLIRLPRIIGCYQAPREEMPVAPLPALKNGFVTYGCLNNRAKITEPVVELWCKILKNDPRSRLILLAEPGGCHLNELFMRYGVDPRGRVECIGTVPRQAYLDAFNRIDIALDCFPYNGHTTSCDGFWMGVPLVTFAGNSYVSRMGLSLLTNLDLPQLIARSEAQYVSIATELAGNLDKLGQLRESLRDRLQASSIMDGPALARDIESVYRQVWKRYCESTGDASTSPQVPSANAPVAAALQHDVPQAARMGIEQLYELAKADFEAGRLPEAEIHSRRMLQIDPDLLGAIHLLALVLQAGNRLEEAEGLFQRCVELDPNVPEHRSNWGALLGRLGRFDQSERELRIAVERFAAFAPAHRNLGITLIRQGQVDQALAALRRAVELTPEDASAQTNLGMALMFKGDFETGLKGMEWRLRTQPYWWRALPMPLWQGESLSGKTILLHAEQGLGDTVQFVRYARLVREAGAKVFLMVQAPLCGLMQSVEGVESVLPLGTASPKLDLHAPLMSLPALLRTTLRNIPNDVPYLRADAHRIRHWERQLHALGPGMKIGIAWQGNANFYSDRHRSIPLARFEPMAKLARIRLISLQKGQGTEQLTDFAGRDVVVNLKLDHEADIVRDTPAMISNLDLVITSDTAVAHLAGALGVPVWVALGTAPDWRWMADRKDSPWYPTMRLFRQKTEGDWNEVFEEMAQELARSLSIQLDSSRPQPTIKITPGELLDRLSILRLKAGRAAVETQRNHIADELAELEKIVGETIPQSPLIEALYSSLSAINDQLWKANDKLHIFDTGGDFGPAFVELSRSVCHLNDRRSCLKGQIDRLLGSKRIATKVYAHSGPVPSSHSPPAPRSSSPSVEDAVSALNKHQPETARRLAMAVLEREPQNARATHIVGLAAHERGDIAEAMEWIGRSIALEPTVPAFHNNLGEALRKSDRLEEALVSYCQALQLKEDYPDAHFNMGIAYRYLGQIDKALACNKRAVALNPNDPEIHLNLSITHLLSGDLANGFAEYEWRWKAASFKTPKRRFRQPQWQGQDIAGQTILVHAEQGFGDAIQFCRYVPLLAYLGAQVTLEVQPEVKTLLQCLPAKVVARGEALGEFDYHCPMLSLPLGFKTILENVPAKMPYLTPDPARIDYWRQRFADSGRSGKKVGLVWAGRPTHQNDHNRSIFLEQLLPLGSVQGIRLISLQQGGAAGQARRFADSQASGMVIEEHGPFSDFADTAAFLANLDLLVSVDTAVAHLAGALGKAVWMLNPLVCDWRWIFGRDDSPWYPTLRIFRQTMTGKWEAPIARLADALDEFAKAC